MDNIKEFTLIFCIASILSAVSVFLIPDGAFKKIFIQINSLVLIAILVTHIFKFDFSETYDFSMDSNISSEQEEYSVMILEYMLNNGVRITETEINNVLDAYLTGKYNIEVVFDTDTCNTVKTENIKIFISKIDSVKISLIKNKVGELTGIIPEVIIYE